jgi:RND family efflux transporter MFP subunit
MLIRQNPGPELLQLQHGALPDTTLTTVRAAELPAVLETTGQIAFDDRRVANIISRVSGRIEEVRVSQWDLVRRGQPILTLYSPDLMTAEAEYLQAKATVPVLAGGSSGDQQFAQSMVEAARRKLELLGIESAQIQMIKIAAPTFVMRAPISGTVVQNQALRGSAVNPGDVLYSVGTLDDVWITADIYEDELARVQVGQQLEAVTTAYPDELFHGTVARISPNVDSNTHTLQIRCQVKNPGLKLKPQMLARVRIVVDTFVVMAQVPLACLGGVLALVVTRTPFSVSAAVGFISIFGIATMDGILLSFYIRKLWDQGHPFREAIIMGSDRRLRATMMTDLVDAFGLLPMALSTRIGAQTQRPLAIVVIGGALAIMLLTRILQPVLIYLCHRRLRLEDEPKSPPINPSDPL